MRKFIIIFIILLVLAVIAGVVFGLLSKKDGSQGPVDLQHTFPISLFYPQSSSSPMGGGSSGGTVAGENEEGEETGSQLARPIPLSSEEVYGFWVSSSTAYFLTHEGELKKNDGTGEFSLVSFSYGVPIRVAQNPQGTAAAVIFDSGSTYVYRSGSNVWELLDSGLSDVAFSPDGESLLGLRQEGSETIMVRYDPFSTPKRTSVILRMSGFDMRVQWPSVNRAVLTTAPSYYSNGQVWVVNLQARTFSRIASGRGVDALTSWNDTHLLVFSSSRSEVSGAIYDLQGQSTVRYPRTLLGEKCGASLSTKSMWCGAPQLFSRQARTLPDDYLMRKLFTHDELVSLNVQTGEFFTVPVASDAYMDMSHVLHANGVVYFINRLDGRVYEITVGI